MLMEVEAEIADSFPDIDDLSDEYVNVQDELVEIETQMAFARDSSRDKLERKMRLVASINRDQQQVTDTVIALDSFEQLKRVYESDIARLESIEESGFLLGLNGDDCPVCGAALENQVHKQVLTQIEASRAAAEIEIAKVMAAIRNEIEPNE
jgi:DNA repair exonuclease SbcCD ATPase subunit